MEKVDTLLVGIGGKPVKVEGSVELMITLGDKDRKRIFKQSFMVAKIEAPYNVIFDRSLLNKLYAVLSPQYLMMKFEINKGIAFIRSDQIETRKGCILVVKATMKQS